MKNIINTRQLVNMSIPDSLISYNNSYQPFDTDGFILLRDPNSYLTYYKLIEKQSDFSTISNLNSTSTEITYSFPSIDSDEIIENEDRLDFSYKKTIKVKLSLKNKGYNKDPLNFEC